MTVKLEPVKNARAISFSKFKANIENKAITPAI